MAIVTVDSVQVVHEALTASGSELHALIGSRAYSPVAPHPSVWSNANPAVIYRPLVETTNASGGLEYIEMQFRCYGGSGSYTDARRVYRALRDRLEHSGSRSLTSGRIERAFLVSARQEPLEPETGWPCHTAIYRLILS